MRRQPFPVLALAAALVPVAASGCLSDGRLKRDNVTHVPDALPDWPVATPAEVGLDPQRLDALFARMGADDQFETLRGALLARHGNLVAEAYFRDPADRDRPHHLQSATKTVTSLLAGIAIDQGLLPDVDVTIGAVIPDAPGVEGETATTTLRDLLSMRAGLAFDNSADTEPLINDSPDSLAFVLGMPREAPPGHVFHYNDGSPHVVSSMIQAVAGVPQLEFARQHLFGPLGITDLQWEHHPDGRTWGAFGLWLRPRDMLKLGQLVLQRGMWDGQPIVSGAWLDASQAVQAYPFAEVSAYGWYWWVKPDLHLAMAIGHGGQFIVTLPDQDMVLVLTADPYTDSIISYRNWDMETFFVELIDCVVD